MEFLRIQDELNFAKKRYELTKKIETSFVDAGFIQIKPEIFEEYDEITQIDKNISTKSMVKVVSNKVMVLRPDITISLMKNLIPRWEDDLSLKLFYHSTVYKNKRNGDGIIQCRQFGCEYLGEPSMDADREVVNLAFNILRKFTDEFLLEIGSGNYIDGFVEALNIDSDTERQFKKLLYRKNKPELEAFAQKLDIKPELKELMVNILSIRGTLKEVTERANKYFTNARMKKGIDQLNTISTLISKEDLDKYTLFDLSMVSKLDYYDGIMLKGYYKSLYKEILSGGRYDSLTESFGKRVPAIGFTIYFDALMEAINR
ncbi:ATP phosphoribosyltransferase regulatory subunit [Clostridium sp. 1001270J_160509_D11]|jgi:ATP phosphoribosyltransferase regulatory subunit|uniref:ATP phosphoribosyltransferase regulatory subunit n=2 Tax=Bacillota TaxID=1239 RepID=UPI0018A9416B|nr:ATP phosphoribosyltransferase regulatory subunit [Clostridium sp. 1001270J_160509_D11]